MDVECLDIGVLKDKYDPVACGLDIFIEYSYLIDLDNDVFVWTSKHDNFNVTKFEDMDGESRKYMY